ncbi:RNA polymerase sigma factor [Peribacillus simplex]|uniref:RNA polymerase sigma factor n=1 Tax=Peribacillus simplex TaxID=1478 RepID=UPI0025A282F1|nr:RNA polymerase sigma factor [Peribacillus simplex]MDM5296337.1 RNA polymerase sigma factor [Peribacillus simplex]
MDNELLQQLMGEKIHIIKRYLIKIGANPLDAEDIVQESLYKLILYIDSVEPEKVSSWLFRVALNNYYDLCRKQNRNVTVTMENQVFMDNQPLPEEHIDHIENRDEINATLNQLKPLYKHLLVLKYELELSYEEICEMLDMKIGTLKTYIFRARTQFKKTYEKGVKEH